MTFLGTALAATGDGLAAAGAHLAAAGSSLAAAGEATGVGGAEQIVFWIIAPLALLGGVGMLFSRGAVHSAMWLVVTMLSLGVIYITQEAEFIGFAQIIVYTGAIMMLFLFVLMLVGRDSGDSVIELLRGQRIASGLLGIGLVGLLATVMMRAFSAIEPVGLTGAMAERGAVGSLAASIFTDFLFPFELTSALLITAALGAMVLAHIERPSHQRSSQKATVLHRMKGDRMSPLTGPGVHATSASNATPAMLPDGSIAPGSVPELVEWAVTERVAQQFQQTPEEERLVPILGADHPRRPHRPAVVATGRGELAAGTGEGGNDVIPADAATHEGSQK